MQFATVVPHTDTYSDFIVFLSVVLQVGFNTWPFVLSLALICFRPKTAIKWDVPSSATLSSWHMEIGHLELARLVLKFNKLEVVHGAYDTTPKAKQDVLFIIGIHFVLSTVTLLCSGWPT
jgi:hypothetical protein